MMASAKASTRGRYTAAGYRREGGLYISAVPAGSAQEELRDLNRVGYRSERPWREQQTPEPALTAPEPVAAPQAPVRARTAGKKRRGFFERVARYARADRKGVAFCVALCCAMLMMIAAWGGEMVDGVVLARDIAAYQNQTHAIETENESLMRQLELASSGERIRNLAQNELGMLRPERAQQETIYIRSAERAGQPVQQDAEGPRMELLDILLGLLDVFHIGE